MFSRGGEYRPRANTCPDLCIIPKESISKMPIKVAGSQGGREKKGNVDDLSPRFTRQVFQFSSEIFSLNETFQRNRWLIGGGGTFFSGRKNTAITDNAADNNRYHLWRRINTNYFAK